MISDINFTTSQIRMFKDNIQCGTASGFFFRKGDDKFYITNRHVFIQESNNFFPDKVKLKLHCSKTELTINHDLTIKLYDSNRMPTWLEHPRYSQLQCDIVALPLNLNTLDIDNLNIFLYRSLITFMDSNLTEMPEINPFGDVAVIGYPLGFYDTINNLPIYRKAMIASQYGVRFNGKPYFLIDANLHLGTSGSPVLSTHHTLYKEEGINEGYTLFGIHSAEHTMNETPLGLNVVWYSYLINEIIDGVNLGV